MPEPISHTTAGTLLAAPIAAAAGSVFGIEPAAIGWAFVGGVLSLIWIPKFEHWFLALFSIGASTVIGAASAQWSAIPVLLTVQHFAGWLKPWAETAQPTALCALAFFIGLFSQKATPWVFDRLETLVRGKKDAV